jgi:hypothetical protein
MHMKLDALKARTLVVLLMFVASACVIQRAHEQEAGEVKPEPKAEPAKADPTVTTPGKAETAVVKQAPKKNEKALTAKVVPAKAAPAPSVQSKAAPAAKSVEAKPAETKVVAVKPTEAKPAEVKLTRVVRYVGVQNLNVRSRADTHAPIVGRLAQGSMITVSVDGAWAKIGEGQFVAVKHLTKTQTAPKRLVSRK